MNSKESKTKSVEKTVVSVQPLRGKFGNIISLVSGKGGVGKTVIVANLGLELAQRGYRVLLIDMDFFTHGLTFYLTKGKERFGSSVDQMIHILIELFPEGTIKPTSIIEPIFRFSQASMQIRDNLWLLPPVSETLKTIDARVLDSDFAKHLPNFFQQLRQSLNNEFDFIIIDQRSGTDYFTISTTSLSDQYILVTEEDKTSLRASFFLTNSIKTYQKNQILKSSEYAGFIVNMFTGRNPEFLLYQIQNTLLGGKCFGMIPLYRKVREVFVKDKVMIEEFHDHDFSKIIKKLASLLITSDTITIEHEHKKLLQIIMRKKEIRKILLPILPIIVTMLLVFIVFRLFYINETKNLYIPFVILLSFVAAVVPWLYILWTKWEEWQ